MSTPTTPRSAQRIAFSTTIAFSSALNVRSIIRINPARTCGYSSPARSRPRIERRDPLRAVGAADRRVHGPLDRERARLDQLRPVVDGIECIEVRDAARIGDRDEPVELPVVLDREGDPLL